MKKVTFLIIILCFVLPLSAFASSDQARGIPFKTNTGTSITEITDGDSNTSYYHIWYSTISITFDKVLEVNSVRLRLSGNSVRVNLFFYDDQGKQLQANYNLTSSENNLTYSNLKNVKKVEIYNNSGNEVYVHDFELFGLTGPPAAPSNLTAAAFKDYTDLSWNIVNDDTVTGYYVYVNDQKSALITSNSYRAPTTNNVNNRFYVKAFNGYESAESNIVTAYYDAEPPPAPTLTGEALEEKVRLSWNKTADDTKNYKVYRDGALYQTTTSTVLTIDAAYNVSHSYYVIAVDQNNNESIASNSVTLVADYKRDNVAPSKPIGLAGEAKEGYISLSWSANSESDLKGYYVYVDGKMYGSLIDVTKIDVTGLISNRTYSFRVAAVDLSNNVSAYSDELKVRTLQSKDSTPPAAPRNLTAALSSNYLDIVLSWGAVNESDVIGYYLYVSDDDLNYDQHNAMPVVDTSYIFSEIEGNRNYYFKVAAVDSSGNISNKTNAVMVSVPTRDPNEQVEKKKELLVKWNEILGAVNYLIYFNGVLIATTDNDTFSFVIDEQYGYTGQPPVNVQVKARFEDGSTGYDKNLGTQSKWGFSIVDLWQAVQKIVISVGSFLLLGIVIRFAPRIFRLVKESILKRRHSQ